MAGYIGQTPGIGQTQYFTYTCTAGQTSFSGVDDNKYVLNYNVGFVDVFLNGRRLTPGSDFTATDGSSITLLAAASASDILFVTALSAFSTAQWVTNAVNYVYTATANQTTFTGVDNNSATLSYVAGTIVVSVNGIILPQSDYTALNGTSVVLASGVNAGDIVQIFSLRTVNPINISSWITNNLTNLATYTYIATQGQTTFSGSAYAGGSLAYATGCIQVIVNGLLLTPADYTATNGTSVVLNVGCNADDTVVIWVYSNTTVAGVYTQAQSDAKYLQLAGGTMTGSVNTFSVGTGVAFPATQYSSSDANTLDDYEEGTWTPTTTGISGTGIAYTAKYVKIGRIVFCSVTVTGTGMTATAPTITQPFSGTDYGTGSWTSGGNGAAGTGVVQSVPYGNAAQLTGNMTSTSIMNIGWFMLVAT